MAPRVSMLLTVYNGGPYLRPAVESVLASELADFEFVIVDNRSIDGSRDYLAGLADRRIRFIANERNLGQTGALNVGLRACVAPLVAHIDADDLDLPDRMGRQAEYLERNPKTALIGGQTTVIDSEGRAIFTTRFPSDAERIAALMTLANCFDHSSVMFRRDPALAVGGYPAGHAVSQDFALWSALLRAGHRLENLDRPVSRVRTHPGQAMAGAEAGRREAGEVVRITALNQAWAAGRAPDEAMARTLYRLWAGTEPPGADPSDPAPLAALVRFFAEMPFARPRLAELALFLFGGPCAGSLSVRMWLVARALALHPPALASAEFAKRLARAALPAAAVARLRRL
ncbi:MAG: glycosyltransferase [Proteobacteria bacterium]|nr:glycosyltransferase [Pseudomonadota bacterium]